ncbi:DivIVA domain-containing protein [Sporobacter termitidis]|nr:DivIVA domain-containing protein [Sporobacter termitidis]
MLTPQEISGKEFVKAVFGGYDMSVVDDFLETLTADYTALFKENAILKSKIKVLVEKVEEYRSTDDAMRMALLTAQKLGDEITAEAKRKSEELLNKTEADIRERLLEMKNKFADEDTRLKSVKEETRKFIAISQEIIRQHSLFLNKLEELNKQEPGASEESAPAPAPVQEAAPAPAPAPSPAAPAPAPEDEVTAAARQIDDAVSNLAETEGDPFAPLFQNEETTKLFRPRQEGDAPDDDEPTSPRPKFDFNNLKFGSNYSGD